MLTSLLQVFIKISQYTNVLMIKIVSYLDLNYEYPFSKFDAIRTPSWDFNMMTIHLRQFYTVIMTHVEEFYGGGHSWSL